MRRRKPERRSSRRTASSRITVREALERIRTEPDKPLPVIRTVRYFQVMTLKELLDSAAVGEDAFLSVVTQPYRIESATLADLLRTPEGREPRLDLLPAHRAADR